jgi:PEP-CTERM motif
MSFGKLVKAALAASVLASGAVHAAPTYYFGNAPTANGSYPTGCPNANKDDCAPSAARTSFEGQIQDSVSETFENRTSLGSIGASTTVLNNGTLSQQDVPQTGLFLGGVVTEGSPAPGGPGRFNTTNGTTFGKWFETDWSFAIDLVNPVQAFGFYGTDFNDFAGTLAIRLLLNGALQYADVFAGKNAQAKSTNTDPNTLDPISGVPVPNGSLVFFGFTTDATRFDRIEFLLTQSGGGGDQDYLGFDDIMVGNLKTTGGTIPEPGSLALAGLALVAAGWARKTQRRA